jgi:starvation-inducible outer membrane lipoprotein
MKCEFHVILLACMMIVTASCAQSAHQTGQNELQRLIPADVLSQVDESVSFTELRADPHQYVGKTVMFSGVALKSRRVKDGTEIEILQVPTQRGMSPSDRKARSEGRFLAVQSNGFLDPAVIEKDTPLTVVGEVKGATTKALDEGQYQYPILDVKQLIDWKEVQGDTDGYNSAYSGRRILWTMVLMVLRVRQPLRWSLRAVSLFLLRTLLCLSPRIFGTGPRSAAALANTAALSKRVTFHETRHSVEATATVQAET